MTSCISAMTSPKSIFSTKSEVSFLRRLSISIIFKSLFSSKVRAYLISWQHPLMFYTVANMHLPLSISLTRKGIGSLIY